MLPISVAVTIDGVLGDDDETREAELADNVTQLPGTEPPVEAF